MTLTHLYTDLFHVWPGSGTKVKQNYITRQVRASGGRAMSSGVVYDAVNQLVLALISAAA